MVCAVADTVGVTVVESVSSSGCLASFPTAYSTGFGLLPSVDPWSLADDDWDVESHLRVLRVVFIAIFTSSFHLFDGFSSNIGVGSTRS